MKQWLVCVSVLVLSMVSLRAEACHDCPTQNYDADLTGSCPSQAEHPAQYANCVSAGMTAFNNSLPAFFEGEGICPAVQFVCDVVTEDGTKEGSCAFKSRDVGPVNIYRLGAAPPARGINRDKIKFHASITCNYECVDPNAPEPPPFNIDRKDIPNLVGVSNSYGGDANPTATPTPSLLILEDDITATGPTDGPCIPCQSPTPPPPSNPYLFK